MMKSSEGSAGLLHKITKPAAWRGGTQILKKVKLEKTDGSKIGQEEYDLAVLVHGSMWP